MGSGFRVPLSYGFGFHSIGFSGYWVFKIYAISLKNIPDFDQIAYAGGQENEINLFSYLSIPIKDAKMVSLAIK